MAEQKQPDNNQKSSLATTIIIAVFILIAAFGIGLVIRNARTNSSEQKQVAQSDENNTQDEQERPRIIYTTIPPITEIPEPMETVEEIFVEPEPEPIQQEPAYFEEENNNNEDYYATQRREDAAQWISWLSTLTEEERTALFRGSIVTFMQLMQRWQNIPPEQVMQERAFLEELVQGWRDLPPEDRQQGIENIQNQLEEWLQYGQQY